MRRQNARVIVASQYPKVRHLLGEAVKEEPGTVVVGQAENATKALTLARNLRPDFAVIDCYLPYTVSLENVPMSRIGGLDTAQVISEEIPNVQVILVTNVDVETASEDSLGLNHTAFFSKNEIEANIPFKLQELWRNVKQPSALIFANVVLKPPALLGKEGTSISDAAVFFGGLGILAGLCLIATWFLAYVGVFLALVGGATMLLGVVGKLVASLRSKTPGKEKE